MQTPSNGYGAPNVLKTIGDDGYLAMNRMGFSMSGCLEHLKT